MQRQEGIDLYFIAGVIPKTEPERLKFNMHLFLHADFSLIMFFALLRSAFHFYSF